MASNAFHLMKVLRAQLTSHFRDSQTNMQQANFTSTLSRKAMNDPLFSPTSFVSSQPLPAPYQQYYQYPEDADEFGDLNEWVRLIREEIVENREWIERMRTTQLEGGPRGGVYRVSRPPEEGLKFLDEARELLNELSVVLQNQGSTPSILQSMMGQGLRSRKFTDALGVVRRASTGNFKDGGSGTYGSPGSSGIHTRPSGNGKGSSIVSPSQSTTATFTFTVPVAAAFNQVGILPTINTGSEDEVESQLDMLSEGLDSENVSSWGNDRLMRVVAPMSSSTTARNEGENFASILTDISEREENENSTFDEAAVFPFEGFQTRAISFPELGDSLALETPDDAVRPSANVFLGESEGRSGGRNDESSWIGSALARLFRLQRQL